MRTDLLTARAATAAVFVTGGWLTLRDPVPRAADAKPFLDRLRAAMPAVPASDLTLVRLNAAVHVAGGAAVAAGLMPRTSALILAASLVPTTAAGHAFWAASPEHRPAELIQAAKNLAVLAVLAHIAAG